MVRGFWGDIIQSPYIPFGLNIYKEPEATLFKKQINFQQVYSSRDFSDYNLQNYITILEDLEPYDFPFSRVKAVEKELDAMAGATGGKDEEEKIEEVKEEDEEEKEEEKTKELTEEEVKRLETASATTAASSEETKSLTTQGEELVNKLKQPGKKINLEDIEEGDAGESHAQDGDRQVLQGFAKPKVKIHLMADKDLASYSTKRKYQGLFDIGVMSVHSADKIGTELTKMFKDKAKVHCESADYLFIMKPEQRVEFRAKVFEKAQEATWTVQEQPPYTHHMLFEVNNPEANNLPADDGDDSSDIDLSNF